MIEDIRRVVEGKVLRVVGEKTDEFLVIDCNKKTMPYWVSKQELESFEILEDGKSVMESLNGVEQKTAIERFRLVAGVLPHLEDANERALNIRKISESEGITSKTLRKYLCEYLATNDIGSLAFHKAEKKEELTREEKDIRWALNKFYYTEQKQSLKTAWRLMLKEKYCDKEGNLLEEYPSYNQFRYFFSKYNHIKKQCASREGVSFYERNERPLLGDGVQAIAPCIGHGMLDATVLDIYLVDECHNAIGRPYLSVCVDAYSGLLCGYSLSWESGMYSLRDLMLNIVSDKKALCEKFGILISEEDWPCRELPGEFITDRGAEYISMNFEQITDLGIKIVNLPPYRPDLKGPVESFFDAIQGYFKPYLKNCGIIEPDFQERGARDYRKEACLTLKEFEAILLRCIIHYNAKRTITDFHFTEKMMNENVLPHPSEIWKYSKKNDACCLLNTSEEKIALTLLPRTKAKFNRKGLIVNKMRYENPLYIEEYLNAKKEVVVTYNPDDVSKVWMFEKGEYIPFVLIEARYMEKSLMTVNELIEKQKRLEKEASITTLKSEIELARHIETVANLHRTERNANIKDIKKTRERAVRNTHKNIMKEVKKDE